MAKWKKFCFIPLLLFSFAGCLGLPENTSQDEELISETALEDTTPVEGADEFSEFDNASDESVATSEPQPEPSQESTENSSADSVSDSTSQPQDEFAEFEQAESVQPEATVQTESTQNKTDELDLGETAQVFEASQPEPQLVKPETTTTTPTPQEVTSSTVSRVDEIDPFASQQIVSSNKIEQTLSNLQIKSIQYKANDAGGAILIQADGPVNFTTRNNPETNQLIVEIPGAQLPDRLKRPFNMRDINGAFGSLDPYQEKGSLVARFVVQLRSNVSDPVVVAEGNTLLIVADKNQISTVTATAATGQVKTSDEILATDKILTSRSLQEFLADNSKFYGKKVSIETNSMSVRDALRFISEEGGVNMIIADNVTGNVSLKLRDIPWDQAFVIIMKSKNLGYIRQGNVLRVATLGELRTEEEATIKLVTDRIKIEPLVVKVFPINYAKVDDLAARVKEFLTERGKVVGDPRTNTVVITDIPQSIARVEQLIQSLDTQPPQVLIEGRIIEATDSFQRQIGINWSFSGAPQNLGTSGQGEVSIRPNLAITTGSASVGTLGFQLGRLDIFGTISATLSLAELENKIRILASPRVVTLSNEKATISQNIQRPYLKVTTVNGVTSSSPEFKNLELLLDVTPQVTSDASVIMSIKVKRDLIGEVVNGEASVESREANTKVMVKNGQTSVIGGVYQNDSTNSVTGVPWLKDIPVLGSLFRFSDTNTRRTELMIFITPRVVSAGTDSMNKSGHL